MGRIPRVSALLLLTACAAPAGEGETERSAAMEAAVAQACTHHSLSADACARLMHYCFNDIDRCEIMGQPILPAPG